MEKLTELTALELGAAIKKGEVSIEEATRAALEAVEQREGELNCFITRTGEQALERARALQAGVKETSSPLYGVPMAIKDNICTKGVKTSCASKILGDFKPPYEATAAERMERAGCVSLGKLNMDEFAMGSTTETSFYGPTHNPWDTGRVPGGSSGGAAAAVAGRECWYALGSDTGGSIRQPASYCGVTGIKPTYGTVSRYGLIAYASSLDQIGPLARSAADCAAVLDALMGKDPRDGTSLDVPAGGLLASLTGDVRGMKIGLPADCFGEGLDPEVRRAMLEAADVLKSRGAQLVEFDFPVMEYMVPTYYIIAAAEASSNLSRFDGVKYGWRAEGYEDLTDLYCKTRTQGFGAEVKRRILLGTFVLSSGYYDAYYKKALQAKGLIKAAFDDAFGRCDLMLTPVAPTTAPKLGESLSDPLQMYLSDIDTVSVNLAGLPGLSMPCGFDKGGMPIGAQLIGPALGEAAVLNAAHAFQMDTDWHKRSPYEKEVF
ncbi:Asp-tRNA(Asn)/Glu-tRNA(Gln) amidotransferase subunit GatA [Pseudoflavonifractor sp. AF19-9AC]|uniref:Asp-tRNA(Asn)/Glu-tRNA(Gln) amidotransferase subunit GatA n=1 Tax=Pseudoflavonifractor sp. AF19-9AC TaxID=2292244 RepID=UPI000E51E058|nr:Asp-tRNA(Asn)/Glu-tRNA(Gln) amidotransferase subunit GatA [Pseudoflavonifractor sp. AF19-9AC]RHR06097.1 Asp-tRNA(Asn)/Glu-tRNA(Gln) amidotransferase subunit GatA [Pseudoflavonifractor sp. AF19-9AC]